MHISIVGAGYVGLVTAACLAHIGHEIVSLDVDAARIARLQDGELPFHELGLGELVAEGLANGRLRFTTDHAETRGTDLIVVAVGTLDAAEEWDGATVRAAVLGIVADRTLPRDIVIRSTLMPGTAAALADEVRALDPEVRLAHNPEFTREAVAVQDFLTPDRVVIGVDGHDDGGRGTALAEALREVYAPLEAPIVVTDLTSAETIKVASNVFLAAKITFANEISRLTAATGADAHAVVEGMGLDKRIVRHFLSPGPGFGGSCFPSQARALPQLAASYGVQTPLMDAIWPSNVSQAEWLLDGLERTAGRPVEGMHVALLGLSFKAGTDDLRESPAMRLARTLAERGAAVVAYDPLSGAAGVDELHRQAPDASISLASSSAEACADADAVVVATEWPQFGTLDWSTIAPTMRGAVVVDGRRIVDAAAAAEAGLRVIALGVEVKGAVLQPAD
ncbi:MAG: UDP-glucose/GDP-mannose dehydrogenase family protein [Candidatus Limnocylindrales bacterium]